MIQIGIFFPKPWWSAECLVSLRKRKLSYRIFRNTKSPRNMINWKKARAEHRQVVRKSKRQNWQQFISEISSDTPIKKVWEKIRNIKGHAPRKLTILKYHNILQYYLHNREGNSRQDSRAILKYFEYK